MKNQFVASIQKFYDQNIISYFQGLWDDPIKLITVILDVAIVAFLFIKLLKITKKTRAWQLLKGIMLLLIITGLSSIFHLTILNYILTSIMTYGALVLIVIFQPELRRGLEQLGTNKFTKYFGIDKSMMAKTKEDIYKMVIATCELASTKTGALIVIEREIQIKDIVSTGVLINGDISPQLLVNLFTTKTPLHDGAVVISNNKVAAAACMLPLADDKDIARELGTRHRAAIGISKESDAIAIVVSEETGKISIAKDGTLIADVKEEALRKILIKHVLVKRFGEENTEKTNRLKGIRNKLKKAKIKNKEVEENK